MKKMTPRERQIRNGRIVAAVLVIIALFVAFRLTTGKHYDKHLAGEDKSISYEVVNVRTKPVANGQKTVVDQLYEGDIVTLTGYKYSHLDGDHSAPADWVEIKYGETTAWITADAVKWVN